jgi:hypothetical protein
VKKAFVALPICLGLLGAGLVTAGCQEPWQPKLAADKSQLKAATDVFWAVQKMGYIAAKQKPQATKHGCKPFEYLVQKGDGEQVEARFRISVFECPDAAKAIEIVQNPHTRHVDDLLRNRHEGGVLRRQALEIIVRKELGGPKVADELIEALGAL